ncbi:hypothetical protein [Candidatus Poriferisodalis sp.]
MRAVADELLVKGVAEDDFEARQILVQRCANGDIPVVQSDRGLKVS